MRLGRGKPSQRAGAWKVELAFIMRRKQGGCVRLREQPGQRPYSEEGMFHVWVHHFVHLAGDQGGGERAHGKNAQGLGFKRP